MEFLKEISGLLGGGATLLALFTLVWQSKSAKSLQILKEDGQKRLKKVENKLDQERVQREYQHQISKSTYEMIFERRISVYEELQSLKNKHYKYINESPLAKTEDVIETSYTHFIECRRIIENNKLLISEDLSVLYEEWYELALPYFVKMGEDGFEAHYSSHDDARRAQDVYDAQFSSRNAIVDNTADKMDLVFVQVENDIRNIRRAIVHSFPV
ncbi:hypothetical protein [Vibrio sp. ED002]|uniref:hypothetical protein n=1 Tax=Vibrio sp. ED002 TaxID=2785123 RepID=UPI00200E4AE2|nr:hypothetical protein [Vibrio sp. ED002]UQA50956.1 hypothetical protein ITG12_01010 [Vibrio sp. ED002]